MTAKPSKTARNRRPSAPPPVAAASEDAPPPVRASWALKLGAAAFVVVVATAGYSVTGSPDAIGIGPGTPGSAGSPASHSEMSEAVAKLAERLKSQPDDANGWSMLGRSYMVLGRYDDAKAAYQRLAKLAPQEAGVYADLADAAAMAAGRKLAGEPTALIERALQLDPDHRKALALAGSAAFDRGDYAAAARYWDRIADLEPEGSEAAQQARAGAEEARRRGSLPAAGSAGQTAAAAPAAAPRAAAAPPAPGAAGGPSISGTVTLAESLRASAGPDDTVFIFARSAEGPGAPLAVLRRRVRDLPSAFTLDDSMAMNPGAGISSVEKVVVGARVSKSGTPAPQPGDLEGFSAPVVAGSSGVQVVISRSRP